MLRSFAVGCLLFAVVAGAVGCKGEAPSLSIGSGGLSEQTLIGSWDGTFVFSDDAPLDQFEDTVVSVCKSMRIRIDFKDNGQMNMRATMSFPESGEQTSDSQGTWKFVSVKKQAMVIRSTEEDGKSEEATLHFSGSNQFEMKAPDNLKDLGVMRFTRQ